MTGCTRGAWQTRASGAPNGAERASITGSREGDAGALPETARSSGP